MFTSLLDLLPPPSPLVLYPSPSSEQGIHLPAFYPLLPWEPSPSLPRPAFVHPPSPRLRLGNVDTLAGETPGTPYHLMGPRGSSGLPRPRAIPLPLSTPHVAPRGAPGYLWLPRSLPPPIGSAMVHPLPLLLARLWHLKRATPSTGPAWWPGALALGFSHLPRCLDLAVWALACTYRD